jgi:pimeloyl-ACP methyl ester carboxylesterase
MPTWTDWCATVTTFRHVCFSHGQESGPWGTKIRHLAELARDAGWSVESLDYQGVADPRERANQLVDYCRTLAGPPVLTGSSMGGFVALAAAARIPAAGLFLLAPALYLPGYEEHLPVPWPDCPVRVVHGWRDDVVPWAGSVRFGAATGADLLLVDGDHRLTAQLGAIATYFVAFLHAVAGDTADSSV